MTKACSYCKIFINTDMQKHVVRMNENRIRIMKYQRAAAAVRFARRLTVL